jgi:hypothetical protein
LWRPGASFFANVSGETAIFMLAQGLSNGQEGPLGLRKLKFQYFNSNFNRRPRPKDRHMKMQKSGLLCATLSSRLLEARNGDNLGRSGLFRASSGMNARQSRSKRLFSCFCRQKSTTVSGEIDVYNPSARLKRGQLRSKQQLWCFCKHNLATVSGELAFVILQRTKKCDSF